MQKHTISSYILNVLGAIFILLSVQGTMTKYVLPYLNIDIYTLSYIVNIPFALNALWLPYLYKSDANTYFNLSVASQFILPVTYLYSLDHVDEYNGDHSGWDVICIFWFIMALLYNSKFSASLSVIGFITYSALNKNILTYYKHDELFNSFVGAGLLIVLYNFLGNILSNGTKKIYDFAVLRIAVLHYYTIGIIISFLGYFGSSGYIEHLSQSRIYYPSYSLLNIVMMLSFIIGYFNKNTHDMSVVMLVPYIISKNYDFMSWYFDDNTMPVFVNGIALLLLPTRLNNIISNSLDNVIQIV